MTEDPTDEDLKKLFEELATAPRRLFELCSGVSATHMSMPIAPQKWTPLQIIQHLVGCDKEALLPRIEKMLASDHPDLPAYDQDAWMAIHGSVIEIRPVQLIDEFARLREKSSILLFDLSADQWKRSGTHEERGHITIFELCTYFARHDAHHIQQIARFIEPLNQSVESS
jgi:hypothetical protein